MTIQSPLAFAASMRKLEGQDTYRERLTALLASDLDFHGANGHSGAHNLHPFPAKFPPQLPHTFISTLTKEGEVVLDPMMGSGTTVLEALLMGRRAMGCDVDPLALLISKVKTTPLNVHKAREVGRGVLARVRLQLQERRRDLERELQGRWDERTRQFIAHWFAPQTQLELQALVTEIQEVHDAAVRDFLKLTFSGIIITKSGGVSMAFDLAHTRPHKAKVVRDYQGEVIVGHELTDDPSPRVKLLTKALRSPVEEFEKRLNQTLAALLPPDSELAPPELRFADAQMLPLEDASVDLIFTSPPYASNAIDYMRAHKFSLVWFGTSVDDLGRQKRDYIGGERLKNATFEPLPDSTASVVSDIARLDAKKGQVLHLYFSEMTRVLKGFYRTLKPGRAAVVVVGCSIMRGRSTETHLCLADIGRTLGFEVPDIGVRHLDRNRRMLPAGALVDRESQIQQRMHEEYIIAFYKPEAQGA